MPAAAAVLVTTAVLVDQAVAVTVELLEQVRQVDQQTPAAAVAAVVQHPEQMAVRELLSLNIQTPKQYQLVVVLPEVQHPLADIKQQQSQLAREM